MFSIFIGTIPHAIGSGETREAAIAAALAELRQQGAIGPGEHQFPDESAAIGAMQIQED